MFRKKPVSWYTENADQETDNTSKPNFGQNGQNRLKSRKKIGANLSYIRDILPHSYL